MRTIGARPVNVHEAKTNFSKLLAEVADGHEIVIARAGIPVARLVPIEAGASAVPRLGFLAGVIEVPDDFDEMLSPEELRRMFEGGA